MRSLLILFSGLLCWLEYSGYAENWPCWRGPRGDGTSLDPNPPIHWNATSNVSWRTAVPGEGHSSPIVWDNRILLTTALKETEERILLCFDRSAGTVQWQQTVLRSPLEAKNPENSYASATPSTDGELVFVTFLDQKEVVVACYSLAGERKWLVKPGGFYSQWGFCHTPVIFDTSVIVCCDSKGENFIAALSRSDGKTLWKVQRDNPTQSYCAPLLRKMAGRMQLVLPGNKAVTSYDPASGKQLWMVDGPSDDCIITPVYNERTGLVLSSSSWPKRVLLAINPDGAGNVTDTKVAWRAAEPAPYVPSPLSYEDWFFTLGFGTKEAYCLDAATGQVLWRQKMGPHHASPVAAKGLVYFLNDEGIMHVVKAGPAFELIARNELGEKTFASPALSQGEMFLRGFKHLHCIRENGQ